MVEQVKPKSLRPRKYLKDRQRAANPARDVKALNQAAERLNREAEDVLEYQASKKKALRLALDVGSEERKQKAITQKPKQEGVAT